MTRTSNPQRNGRNENNTRWEHRPLLLLAMNENNDEEGIDINADVVCCR